MKMNSDNNGLYPNKTETQKTIWKLINKYKERKLLIYWSNAILEKSPFDNHTSNN